jgi:hypothetical protein
MKKTNFLLFLTLLFCSILLVTSCKKDDEETKNPYYGKWQSKAYGSPITPGALEKMVFDFTNTTFEDKVYQGVSADALQLVSGIRGSVDYTAPSTLDAEVNEISVGGSPYVNKNDDPTTFATFFALSMGAILDEEFTATYTMDGDSMIFSLPVKISETPITIKLGRVQ